MRRNVRKAAAVMLLCGAGCSTMRPGVLPVVGQAAPGFTYTAGRATQVFPVALPTVQPATLSALDDLRMVNPLTHLEAGSVVVNATTADNSRVHVMLRPEPSGTLVTARIGLFGDEPLSRALMDRIAVRLGTLPPSAAPVDPPSEPDRNPYFSRSAVSDEEMFKDKADAPYRGEPSP